MTVKSAALFAFAGMVLMTVLILFAFVRDLSSVLRGLAPAMQLLVSLIELIAGLAVTVFFLVFHRAK